MRKCIILPGRILAEIENERHSFNRQYKLLNMICAINRYGLIMFSANPIDYGRWGIKERIVLKSLVVNSGSNSTDINYRKML